MKNFLHEPLLHFLLLGSTLFAIGTWRERSSAAGDETNQIEITPAVIERLSAGYQRQFGSMPDAEELRGLVNDHVREEILFREALAMGLDRDDTIIRRRLAQKMEFLTDDLATTSDPDAPEVKRYFEANSARYARPPRLSFRHVYFSSQKHGSVANERASEALQTLNGGGDEESMGDPFLHGFGFESREPDEIASLFGPAFAEQVAAMPDGAWSGPVASSYGWHLVRIDARTEAAAADFDNVRDVVLRDFNDERRRTLNREIFTRLRERYQVSVDEAALTKTAAPSSKTVAK